MHEHRYRLIQIRPGTKAVVDSTTGLYYGVTEYQGSVWGARDWAGLSLPVGYSENPQRAMAQTEARKSHEWWADRLIERADRAGGLSVVRALGLVDGFLFLPGGDEQTYLVYTEEGHHLGHVQRTGPGRWEAIIGMHTDDIQVLDRTPTRAEAADRLHRELSQQAVTHRQQADEAIRDAWAAIAEDEEEFDPAFIDSYWRRGRKDVKQGWRRDAEGVTTELWVTPHGRWGADVNMLLRPETVSGSSCQLMYLMTPSDMRHMLKVLTEQAVRTAGDDDDQLRELRDALLSCDELVVQRRAELSGVGDEPEEG